MSENKNIMSFIDSIKSMLQTAAAIALVCGSSYGFLNDALDDKIKTIGNEVVKEVVERCNVDDAVFVLNKAIEKFRRGDSKDIRSTNLELVIKYADRIVEYYPEKQPEVAWAVKFYSDTFVNNVKVTAYVFANNEREKEEEEEPFLLAIA